MILAYTVIIKFFDSLKICLLEVRHLDTSLVNVHFSVPSINSWMRRRFTHLFVNSCAHNMSLLSFLDDLKKRYENKCQTHQIHIADKNGRIKLEEVDIDKFAVQLTIRKDVNPVGNFRDEVRKYLESLRSTTSEDIELSQLLDNDKRVTFLRGIAGMGKSLLSKQLIISWSRDEIYNNIKVCIMFECREINVFLGTKAASHLQTDEVLKEFVKTKFEFDLNDGKDILFLIDGFDETSNYSIFNQLLIRNIYPDAKVIITGRPHFESKLEQFGEVGGLQTVEIQGLNDDKIEEYVAKFPFPEGVFVDLTKGKDSSNEFLPVLRIPQFLNTFCCTASLLNFEAIHSKVELYCWNMYLLLLQHAKRDSPSERKVISKIFHEYSKELLTLGEVCHKLLNENKIIILKKDMEALLLNCERGSNFIGSLFVDVSSSFEEKLQFKHLTLMEFLSAVHISSCQNPLEIISDNLKNGYLEVVIFACQLISGYHSRRIIQDMVKVNATKLQQININSFCQDVVKTMNGCKFDERTKFLNSLDIIVSCLNDDVADKSIFMSTVQMLNTENVQTKYDDSSQQYKGILLYVEQSKKLYSIYKHMVNTYKCNGNELHIAFRHIHVSNFNVNYFKMIECVKYFGYVNQITLTNMKLNVNVARREFESIDYGKCKVVRMFRCELEDNDVGMEELNSKLDGVGIDECTLKNVNSLLNAFHWAMSSSLFKQFGLFNLKIMDGWWSALVAAIEQEMSNVKGNFQGLAIQNCIPQLTRDLQKKVR